MAIHLSPRMAAVASAVPAGARVIDVGTDHARIPVWLAQTRRAAHIWASDLRRGPLENARALVAETATEDRIDLRQADGLNGFGPEDGDTVILAGMGGETMAGILAPAPWTKDGVLLILEPQSKQEALRRFLVERGYRIEREALVEDAGRIYPILLARGGEAPAYALGELHIGLYSQISADPLFPRYLSQYVKRAEAAAPYDPAAAALLEEFQRMEENIAHGDCE